MRGNRFWILLVTVLLVGMRVSTSASANDPMRSVLVVHSGDYPEVEHVRAELLALNFRVTLLNNHQPISTPDLLKQAASEMNASVAIEFVLASDALQVWLYDAAKGAAPIVQQFRNDARGGESDRIEALRVVEYLRAALIRADVTPEPAEQAIVPGNGASVPAVVEAKESEPPNPPPSQQPPGRVIPPSLQERLPEQPVVRTNGTWVRPASLWVTLAPGVVALDGLRVLMPAGAVGVLWHMTPQFALTAQILLPLGNAKLADSIGTTDASALGFATMARYNLARKGSPWRPIVGGGVIAIWLDLKRQADPSVRDWTELRLLVPAPAADIGLHWQPVETWSFFASLLAAYSIRESGLPAELDRLGRPATFFASLGVEWRAVAVARRD